MNKQFYLHNTAIYQTGFLCNLSDYSCALHDTILCIYNGICNKSFFMVYDFTPNIPIQYEVMPHACQRDRPLF